MGAFGPISRRRIAYWLRRTCCWVGKDRPGRMWRRGRAVDPEFAPEEFLYVRCRKCHVTNTRLTDVAAIRFPDQSVNRQKYSKPQDVLAPEPANENSKEWIYWGVAGFSVDSVPSSIVDDDRVICDFNVEHDPLEYNYAHSEIRVYVKGERVREKKRINRVRRKRFRLAIMDKAVVVLEPLV